MKTELTEKEIVEIKKWALIQAKEIVHLEDSKADIVKKADDIYEWLTA